MPDRLPKILWQKAEYLVVIRGKTLEQTAAVTGISLSALKKRSTRHKWMERARGQMELGQKVLKLTHQYADNLLSGKQEFNPDGLYKLSKAAEAITGTDPENLDRETARHAWEWVSEAIVAVAPELSGKLQKHAGEILARMHLEKTGDQGAPEKKKGLSAETVAEIHKKVLGVN